MSRIREKSSRRYRVQFTMSQATWCKYVEVENAAAELLKQIDYRGDFEKWFSKLLEVTHKELQQMKAAATSAEVADE